MTSPQGASVSKQWIRLIPIAVMLVTGQLLWQPAAADTPPGIPTIETATAGDQKATVTWIAPSNPGSPITSYVVTIYTGITQSGQQTFTPGGGTPPNYSCTVTTCSATVTSLANGTTYTFTVTAVNGAGPGTPSVQSNAVTPAGSPFAPTNVNATSGNASAIVSWTAPNSNGSPITAYTIYTYVNGSLVNPQPNPTCDPTQTSCTVTGLVNGTTYTFKVAASNAIGPSTTSAASNPVRVGTPAAPTNVQATAGNASASVSWAAPNGNGAAITSYTITPYVGGAAGTPQVFQSTGSPQYSCTAGTCTATATGLINGTTYTFTVSATNAFGAGAPSAQSTGVLIGTPGAATIGQATPGDRQATVTWTAAAPNGSAVTGYNIKVYTGNAAPVTVSNVTFTCTAAGACSAGVTGLTNGTSYTFTVTAQNGVGSGPESGQSNAVTPAGLPQVPTNVSATAGNTEATVTWTAPANNGSPIVSYTVRAYFAVGGFLAATDTGATCSSPTCSFTVTGLTNGTFYTFRVAAVNGVGEGSQSNASNAVSPAAGVPDAPTNATAVAGYAQATISWTAPSNDGGSSITKYVVTCTPACPAGAGGLTVTGNPPATNTTVTGLNITTSYTFTVHAVNSAGPSAESNPTSAVTPGPVKPYAPAINNATAGDGSATVTWTAPPSNGMSIDSYVITPYVNGTAGTPQTFHPAGSGQSPTFSCSSGVCTATVTGLTNGTTYTFTVAAANNTTGTGAASSQSNSVTPVGLPGAPTNVQATPGNATATVTWAPPASNGGSGVTSYTVTLTTGSTNLTQQVSASGTLQATFSSLSNGTTYTVSVVAVNAAGSSPAAQTSVTPVGALPGAPTNVSVSFSGQTATVTWSAPSSGSSSITGYTVRAYNAGTSTVAASVNVAGNTTSASLTGLAAGGTYTFTVTATNAAGAGPESAQSASLVLPSVPGSPTNVQATAGVGQATVSWTAPGTNGGTAITSYVVTVRNVSSGATSTMTVTGSSTSATVTSLVPGQTYTFTVTPVNAVGQGTASSASNSVTIPTQPGAPQSLQVSAQNGAVQITWAAPSSTGGTPITGYQVTVSDGVHTPTTTTVTSTSTTISGLSTGTTYTVTVAAINAVGQGGSTSTAVTLSSSPSSSSAAPSLSLPTNQAGTYGHPLSFDVSATSANSSDLLTLSVAGLPDGLSFTDKGGGHGTVSGTVQAPAGTYTAVVTVDAGLPSAVSSTITITVLPDTAAVKPGGKNPGSIALKGSAKAASTITLKATITAASANSSGNIANAVPLTCKLRSMNSRASFTGDATTKANGKNGLAATCKFQNVSPDVYRVQFTVGGDYYAGSATDFLAVYKASRGSVKAKGTIVHQGVSASFTVSAHFKGNQLQGTLVYIEHRSTGDVTLTSTLAGGLVFQAHKAFFEGTATLKGGGTYTFVATLLSNGYRHAKDRFGLRLISKHQNVPDLSFSPAELSSGSVSVT